MIKLTKKFIGVVLALSLVVTTVFSLPQITAGAETYGDFEYILINNDTEVEISRYNGPGGDVVIPELIDNKPVTIIGYAAFGGYTGIISITIPNSITSIGDAAFYHSIDLKSINIPDSVINIGDEAFYECTGLTSITIPNSVTSIGELAFYGCAGLTSISIGEGVTSIGDWAFFGCTGLESITVDPNNQVYHSASNCLIETQSKTLIQGCKNSVIPTDCNVTSIGDDAFSDCTRLSSITIPDSVTSIGTRAFSNCTGLTNITIPNSVISIGLGAFYECTGLTSITISDSVTSISDLAFSNCTGFTSITIPNSVISIGYWAFDGCTGLKTVRYFGTSEEFEALVTEYDNDWLLDLEIIYMQQLKTDGVVLTVEKGVLQEGTVLNAEKIESDLEQIIEQLPNEYDVKSIVVYELTLTKDGQNVNFDGTVTVCVPLPEGISPNKCRVLYMDDNGNVTDMNAVYKDGAMVFETTHFSTYILVKENSVLSGDLDGDDEITDADAVYLLMHTFFPEDYPVTQACDFDGDGQVTDADAVYLLMYTFFPEDYPIVKQQPPKEPTDPGETEPDIFEN